MSTEGLRKCCHCGIWFRPGRNRRHQHFCLKPACQAASKRASQQKWCRKNPGHFRGEMYVKKTRAWRRSHPGYWKKPRPTDPGEPPDALQDLLLAQGFDNEGVKVLRNSMSEEISRPLQDIITAQHHAIVGLTSMITGDLLQEDIARVLINCYERGQRIGGIVPWMAQSSPQMQKQEVSDERTRTDHAAAAATYTPTVQLGRSPSGS